MRTNRKEGNKVVFGSRPLSLQMHLSLRTRQARR